MHHRFPDKLHGEQKDRISTEMYLKTIYQLHECKRTDPRPVDIVHVLEVSKSSVSEMLKRLADEGFLKYESYGRVQLTAKGKKKAEAIVHKFVIIRKFLSEVLKVPPEKVFDEACNLEHAFSDYTTKKLETLIKNKK